jgi:hypothetical protein
MKQIFRVYRREEKKFRMLNKLCRISNRKIEDTPAEGEFQPHIFYLSLKRRSKQIEKGINGFCLVQKLLYWKNSLEHARQRANHTPISNNRTKKVFIFSLNNGSRTVCLAPLAENIIFSRKKMDSG